MQKRRGRAARAGAVCLRFYHPGNDQDRETLLSMGQSSLAVVQLLCGGCRTLRILVDRHTGHAGVANRFRTDDRKSWSPDAVFLDTFPVRRLPRPVYSHPEVINVNNLCMQDDALTEVTRSLAKGTCCAGMVSSRDDTAFVRTNERWGRNKLSTHRAELAIS